MIKFLENLLAVLLVIFVFALPFLLAILVFRLQNRYRNGFNETWSGLLITLVLVFAIYGAILITTSQGRPTPRGEVVGKEYVPQHIVTKSKSNVGTTFLPGGKVGTVVTTGSTTELEGDYYLIHTRTLTKDGYKRYQSEVSKSEYESYELGDEFPGGE